MRTTRMKFVSAALTAAFLLAVAGAAHAAIKTETITYKEGQVEAHSFIAYDDSSSNKRPGVLVVPEWWGRSCVAIARRWALWFMLGKRGVLCAQREWICE